jgi:hypothetical protein
VTPQFLFGVNNAVNSVVAEAVSKKKEPAVLMTVPTIEIDPVPELVVKVEAPVEEKEEPVSKPDIVAKTEAPVATFTFKSPTTANINFTYASFSFKPT